MADANSSSRDSGGTDRGVNRRTVLKGMGTGAVAGVGLVGTASGHEVRGKPMFCGCTQLCVCVDGNADVLMARETDDGGYDVGFLVGGGELDPYPQGEPRYSGNFCVSTDDAGVPDGKIIGLQVAGTRWVNPNDCAQDALDAERAQLDSTHQRPAGDSGDNCENPPCEDETEQPTFEFEMDDQTITLAREEAGVSTVTVTGTAKFRFDGWEEADHAWITVWAQSETIDTGGATNSDAERYFDIDQPAVVRNDVEITFDVPPEVGDPDPGETIETEITGVGFFGLEDGMDPQESFNIFDRREYTTMTLTVERT